MFFFSIGSGQSLSTRVSSPSFYTSNKKSKEDTNYNLQEISKMKSESTLTNMGFSDFVKNLTTQSVETKLIQHC